MQYYTKGRDVDKRRRDLKAKPYRIPSCRDQNSVEVSRDKHAGAISRA